MAKWTDEHTHETATNRSFAADMMSLGPASTLRRELLAAVLQTGAVVLLVFVLFPDRFPGPWRWALLGATVVYFVFRFAAGIPAWSRRT